MAKGLIDPFTRTYDLFGDGHSVIFIGPDEKLLTRAEWEDLKARTDATYDRVSKADIERHNAEVRTMSGRER